MSKAVTVKEKNSPTPINLEGITKALMYGDLSKLTEEQRLEHYNTFCNSVGLNPITNPLQYITLNNKLVLYAGKNCTEQLRENHHVSVVITSRERIADIYVVSAKATLAGGRTDESTGAVNIKGLAGDALANAFMKAETKAKRRVTLSICGLGVLDESEIETIPGAKNTPPQELKEAAKVQPAPAAAIATKAQKLENPGDFVITFTKGFKGKKISELSDENLQKLHIWCIKNNQFQEFQMAAEDYAKTRNAGPAEKEIFDADAAPETDEDEPLPDFENFK